MEISSITAFMPNLRYHKKQLLLTHSNILVMRLSFALLFPLLMFASMFACKRPVEAIASTTWQDYKSPIISRASLRDTIPIKSLPIKEINGIKAIYKNGNTTQYFEYEADADKILDIINRLPFKKTNHITDTTYRTMQITFSLSAKSVLSFEENEAASFFWNAKSDDYRYYECIKAKDTHTILVSKTTGRILHRIESEV